MRQIIQHFRDKASLLFQEEQSTKDRPLGFRILVGLLVGINLFCITLYFIKTIS
ncbi:MAG: hypothetical protein ABIR30_11405 [Chitinophagaceae bacterium]